MKKRKLYIYGTVLLVLVKLLSMTYRIRFFGEVNRKAAEDAHKNGSFCIALWHEYIVASVIAHAGQRFSPLASLSRDGELITFVLDRIGYQTVRGSSNRGGQEGRDGLVAMVDAGNFTAITVDGPKGPRRRIKGGIVDVARRTGVAILPMVAAADRQWVLGRTWDQTKIPKPFARIAVHYSPPILVPEDTSGIAFGETKARVKRGLEEAEENAVRDLENWIAT